MVTKSGEKLLYEKESYLIRGACFDLYRKFGGAFKETIITRALVSELKAKGLGVETQKRIDIIHRNEKIGTYIPDIIINKKILIELKVKPFLTKEDERQFWYYLKGSDYKLGFLVNFGSRKLEIKRRIYDKSRNSIRVNPRSNPRLSASTNRGFTLIEMLVAVFVFSLLIVTITGIFTSAIKNQQRALATQEVLDQSSYVLEYMSRALRMAKKDDIDGVNCLSGDKVNYEIGNIPGTLASGLLFRDYENRCKGFFLQSNQLNDYEQGRMPAILPLTSTKLQINFLKFNLSGENQTDKLQPRVTIFLDIAGREIAGGRPPSLKLQTSVSQRALDVQY